MTSSTRNLLLVSALLGACGSSTTGTDSGTPVVDSGSLAVDSGTPDVDSGRTSTRGTVMGTVTYEGSGVGRLTVGVWPTTPPMGPPAEFFAVDDATFPIDYELEGLAAGTYYIGATLDIGSDNPTIPGTNDPRLFPTDPIVIAGGDTHERDITLTDPE
jgi:hypothetical protein